MIGGIKNFRFWCQKVLPLVYDNSLSYYEILCKVVNYLNHVIDDINQIPDYIDEKVREALDDKHLKELITEVFKTLEDAISANNEGQNTNFSQDYPKLGTLLWHDNKLYKTIRIIDRGDEIIPDVNIELVDFGDMFNEFIDEVKKNFTPYDDGTRETASANRTVHQLVWLDDVLYEVTKPISEGNAYIYTGENTNVEAITTNDIYQYLLGLIADEAQTRQEEDARIELELSDLITSKVGIEAEAREEEDARIELELSDLITSQIGIVEGEIDNLQSEIGSLAELTTSDKTDIVSAINEINGGVKYCNNRSEVAGVNALLGGYILSANAYQDDGVTSLYKVTNETPDSYLNIAMNNGNTASLVYDDVIHAHQVGAYPDGNDCVSAINYIINNVSTVSIKFGKGRYTFTDRIWLNSNQSLIGENTSETILYIDRDPSAQHGEFIGIIGEHGTVKKNITLRDFSIDVYFLASATEDVNPIGMVTAENILIERVNVLRSNWNGFQIEGEENGHLSNVIIRDCVINNVYRKGIGLSHATGGSMNDILIQNVTVNGANGGGMYIEGPYDGTEVKMKNVRVDGLYCHGGTSRGMYVVYASDVNISNVMVDDVSPSLYGVIQIQSSNRIKVNNVTVLCSTDPHDNFAIFLYAGSNIVINELFTTNAAVGIEIQAGADNVVISNGMIHTHAGGNAVRNQVSTLHGYISGCVRNGSVSNTSANFIELS